MNFAFYVDETNEVHFFEVLKLDSTGDNQNTNLFFSLYNKYIIINIIYNILCN